MYPDNDYRLYLMHSARGQEWSKHKYLYKTSTGRYIYPEDVPDNARGGLSTVGESRSGKAYGGSTRTFGSKKRNPTKLSDVIKRVNTKTLKKSDSSMPSNIRKKLPQKLMYDSNKGFYMRNSTRPMSPSQREEYYEQTAKRTKGKSISLRSSSPKSKTKYKYDRYKWGH